MPVIHHPKLRRQAEVGAGFAKALIRDGGWNDGPLPDIKTTTTSSSTTSSSSSDDTSTEQT